MKLPVLFLATMAVAQAQLGNSGPGPHPFSAEGPVTVGLYGEFLMPQPTTYTAPSWSITGELKILTAGTYYLIATTGAVVFNPLSKIVGPTNGIAKLVVITPVGMMYAGGTVGNVAIEQGLPGLSAEPPPLSNISTRTTLAAGQTATAGFVIAGRVNRRLLIRAVGPTLASFGIPNVLAAPTLTVTRSGTSQSWTNSGWNNDSQIPGVSASVGAFPLPAGSRDAAMVLGVSPGAYTVQVNGGAGEVLIEVYILD